MQSGRNKDWLLFSAVPLMLGLLLVDSRMTYGSTTHQIVQLGIAAFTFGLVSVWVGKYQFGSRPDNGNRGVVREHHIEPPAYLSYRPDPTADDSVIVDQYRWLDQATADKGKYN